MYTTRKVCILNLLNEDNKIMNDFHNANWEAKLSVIDKFSDERLKYFGKKLIYEEKPDLLSKNDYSLIHKDLCKKLFEHK